MNWQDEFGIYHHVPNPGPESSENGPMFTGAMASVEYATDSLTVEKAIAYVRNLQGLYRNGRWYTTPVTLEHSFSHDNFTGVVCLLIACEKVLGKTPEIDMYRDAIPWWHDQLDHPRDLAFVWSFKSKWFSFLLPITWGAMFVTCWQGHKVRGENTIAKTDGKILSMMRCWACDWSIVGKCCQWLIKTRRHPFPLPRNNWHMVQKYFKKDKDGEKRATRWSWGKVWHIFHDYFFGPEHPITTKVKQYELGKEEL